MIVLDAFALISLLHDEPAAGTVREVLLRGDCVMNAVNVTEVIDRLVRVGNADPRKVDAGLSGLLGTVIEVRPTDMSTAWRAAAIRARYYHRKDRDLSLADCVLIATADAGDTIATGDAHVASTARAEGIEVLRLRR